MCWKLNDKFATIILKYIYVNNWFKRYIYYIMGSKLYYCILFKQKFIHNPKNVLKFISFS